MINVQSTHNGRLERLKISMQSINDELRNYIEHFKGKRVYIQGEESLDSHLWTFFSAYFDILELETLTFIPYTPDTNSYVLMKYKLDGQSMLRKEILEGDGHFKSKEHIDLLGLVDIVVSVPPRHAFSDYVEHLDAFGVDYFLVGKKSEVMNPTILSLIQKNKLFLGYPKTKIRMSSLDQDVSQDFLNYTWYTSLSRPRYSIHTGKRYNDRDYPKYYNFDAIEVDSVSDIPMDYYGIMGVSPDYLHLHNPDDFIVLGSNMNSDYLLDDLDELEVWVNGKFTGDFALPSDKLLVPCTDLDHLHYPVLYRHPKSITFYRATESPYRTVSERIFIQRV